MEPNLDVLQYRADQADMRMSGIEGKLDNLLTGINEIKVTLAGLPTRRDLESWKWQWFAIGVTMVALILGGIIGGLDWIKPR